MAVMNIPDEIVVHRKHVIMTYAPILLAVPFSGSESQLMHKALARGKKMPV